MQTSNTIQTSNNIQTAVRVSSLVKTGKIKLLDYGTTGTKGTPRTGRTGTLERRNFVKNRSQSNRESLITRRRDTIPEGGSIRHKVGKTLKKRVKQTNQLKKICNLPPHYK